MPVTDVRKDPDKLTLTITAEFDASVERVWSIWADPRQLERWWGPPSHPATFVEHDLAPGGAAAYYMTGPEGDRYHGWWRVKATEPPRRIEFEDGFADEHGNPNESLPISDVTVRLSESGDRTTMEIETRYRTREAMEQVIAMGIEEGSVQALGQIDDLLRPPAA